MNIIFILSLLFFTSFVSAKTEPVLQQTEFGTITIDLAHPRVIDDISKSFGAGIDGHEQGELKKMLSPENVATMVTSGLKPLSYRLRTELGVEAWHWNPRGTWSDAPHAQGYWTSAVDSVKPILVSYGYRLPRRGNTLDEANNDGYSRIDDGDPTTFWKSNPYLTSHYTGEPDDQHPQWVMIDFQKPTFINAIRIHWGDPYATRFRVQWSNEGSVCFGAHAQWHDFPTWGQASNFKFSADKNKKACSKKFRNLMPDPKLPGGDQFLKLGEIKNLFGKKIPVHAIRILMSESSETGLTRMFHTTSSRDAVKSDKDKARDKVRRSGCMHHPFQVAHRAQRSIYEILHKSQQKEYEIFGLESSDPRDRMGYSIREVEAGEIMPDGSFRDHVIHRPDHQQTVVYVSSTDPWHRACDRDEKTEQPGFDFLMHCGLVKNAPSMLWAVPVFYDTPENAAAEIAFLKKRGYLGNRLELGEEPDGQRIDPKDFGSLYCQVTRAIRRVDDVVKMGGLSFVTIDEQPGDIIYRCDHRPWLRRFFSQLKKQHQENDVKFLTFEWYPFDDVLVSPVTVLPQESAMLRRAMEQIRAGGIPRLMPLMISEYGYSVFAGRPEVEMTAALLNTDIAAQFLLLGGETSYLYGYEPNDLECGDGNSWGNLMMLLQNKEGGIRAKLPTFYAAQLVTKYWASPANGRCEIFPVACSKNLKNKNGDLLLSAYMLHRPDNSWSLLLINKSCDHAYHIRCRFQTEKIKGSAAWAPPFEEWTYSSSQYHWHADGASGFPSRNQAPKHQIIEAMPEKGFMSLPWSISIISTKK